jgi:hypothetical protein
MDYDQLLKEWDSDLEKIEPCNLCGSAEITLEIRYGPNSVISDMRMKCYQCGATGEWWENQPCCVLDWAHLARKRWDGGGRYKSAKTDKLARAMVAAREEAERAARDARDARDEEGIW